jgi:hypothetical protein
MCYWNERNVSKVNQNKSFLIQNFIYNYSRYVAKQFLEQIGTISNDGKRIHFKKRISSSIWFIQGSSIALNTNTISIHYALDLLRNLENVKKTRTCIYRINGMFLNRWNYQNLWHVGENVYQLNFQLI